jgi:hypothetical protein
MPKANRFKFRSTRTRQRGNSSLSKPSTPPDSPSYKLYRRISDCPLDVFIDTHCDDNLQLLVIEGDVPRETLQDTWQKMFDDFLDKMQDEDGAYLKDQIKHLNLLRTKIETVVTIVQYVRWLLDVNISVELDDMLAELVSWTGLPVQLNQADKPGCFRMLDMVMAHVTTWKVEGEQMRQEVEKDTAGMEGRDLMDRDYFDQMIVALSIGNKFKVNRQETTVGEFVIMVQALRRQAKEAKEFSNN